jgi:hypothetical protein
MIERNVVAELDARRRVGWAKYYQRTEEAEQLRAVNYALRGRIEDLVPEFLALLDAVLHDRNPAAFAKAYRVQQLIDRVIAGSPKAD